jgi:sugar phosphate isomerase/epimerase
MPFKVAVTSGIYYAARSEELINAIRKLGYTLTRGAGAVEIAADVAHEVPYSHGVEIRHMAKKQGIDVLFHGDLAVPFCIPERGEWREAHDRVTKSIRSAVYAGAKYVNFHACLNIWLELMTYAGRKLTMSFCDQEGNFISGILQDDENLRDWFVEKKADDYARDILMPEEAGQVNSKFRRERTKVERQITDIERRTQERIVERDGRPVAIPPELTREQADEMINQKHEELAKINENLLKDTIREKLRKGGRWDSEELRAVVGIIDGYHIMGHYLFYTKDVQWVAMTKQYPDLMAKYNLDYSNKNWLEEAWLKAEKENDREFKEFFYAAIGAKYLEGHIKRALEWIDKEFIPKELAKLQENTPEKRRDKEELIKIARDLIIAIETPDAREPQHAGLYFLFRPKQIHSVVKTIRDTLKTGRVMTIIDHEHVATQGLDALTESNETVKTNKDLGEIMICVHSNHPNPLQPHAPIEMGDTLLYQLLYNLRTTGLGRNRMTYLLFERGGGEDPFKQSVDTLKLMARFLEKDVHPKNLPLEFFGIKGEVAGDIKRQAQIVQDHMYEPLKDLLEMPEEEWTMLSQAVVKKGKRPEVWKRGEFR